MKTFAIFLLMGFIVACLFLSNQGNLYMIHHDSDVFYDIYNTINEHNRIQIHYLSSYEVNLSVSNKNEILFIFLTRDYIYVVI